MEPNQYYERQVEFDLLLLFLDAVYVSDNSDNFSFHCNKAPTVEQLTELLHTISQRVARFLERRGLLERDEDNSYLTLDGLDEDAMLDIHSHSVTYRIAMGPQRGRKVFTLQTIPPKKDLPSDSDRVAMTRFSLHAGVAAKAHQRLKLERLCAILLAPKYLRSACLSPLQARCAMNSKHLTAMALHMSFSNRLILLQD